MTIHQILNDLLSGNDVLKVAFSKEIELIENNVFCDGNFTEEMIKLKFRLRVKGIVANESLLRGIDNIIDALIKIHCISEVNKEDGVQ